MWQTFREKASKSPRKLVLADGEDPRVIEAAARAANEEMALPVLVGRRAQVETTWRSFSSKPLETLDVDTLSRDQKDLFLRTLAGLPKFKDLTPEDHAAKLQDPLVLGCLALRLKQVEGFIGGAARTTTDTLRAAFSIVGLRHGVATLFGFFLIEKQAAKEDEQPLVLLADCAVIPDPSVKQLSQIGIFGAQAFQFFTGDDPRVAFLSFSTHGSAEHPFVDKMRQALAMAREKAPALVADGEWQADAALDMLTARIKGVNASPMAGRANVLVVPDLNCGNIAYKLVQRLGGCRAVGPVLWGMAQPANDLSRGCTAEDVLDMMALTSLQAQAMPAPDRSPTSMKAQVH